MNRLYELTDPCLAYRVSLIARPRQLNVQDYSTYNLYMQYLRAFEASKTHQQHIILLIQGVLVVFYAFHNPAYGLE
jgi:hypothetical protein